MAEWSRWSVRGAHECVRDVVGWFATDLPTLAFFASVLQHAIIGSRVAGAIGAAVCTQDSLIFDTLATTAAEHE